MEPPIEDVLRFIPEWRGVQATVTPLIGGITNQNYRVDIAEESFVLRVGGLGTHLLGIDRERECACSAIAAGVGIGAEVVFFHASETLQLLVTRFIAGTNLAPEEATQPAQLQRIVEAIQRYHNGPPFPGTFSPFETVRSYHQQALAHGVTFPETLTHAFEILSRIEAACGPQQTLKPCHNDLLASNFIQTRQTIRIIDWEYAGMGDPFFDLGNFAVNQSLDEAQCRLLVQLYTGATGAADIAHLHLMRLASDAREAFWGFLQMGISELDFDYRAYADHHLERFLQNAATPEFGKWLHDIQE